MNVWLFRSDPETIEGRHDIYQYTNDDNQDPQVPASTVDQPQTSNTPILVQAEDLSQIQIQIHAAFMQH